MASGASRMLSRLRTQVVSSPVLSRTRTAALEGAAGHVVRDSGAQRMFSPLFARPFSISGAWLTGKINDERPPGHPRPVWSWEKPAGRLQGQQSRWFSKGGNRKGKGKAQGGKPKPSARDMLQEQLKQELLFADVDGDTEIESPPAEWQHVDIEEHLGAGESGTVMLQKQSESEIVSILTSTELLATDEDYDPTADGGTEESNFHPPFAMLAVIKKPDAPQPLFIECIVESYEPRISRMSVGSGTVGYLCNVYGPITYLYQTYSSVSGQDDLLVGKIMTEEDAKHIVEEDMLMDLTRHSTPGYISPNFGNLPVELQTLLDERLEEKLGQEILSYLVESLAIREQENYITFLRQTHEWLE